MKMLGKRRGIGACRFAREIDIPRTTIENWERGRAMIPLDRAVEVADYFGYRIQFVKKGE